MQTPVLAAVVKGTQFRVTYANGRAEVLVDRGVVQVQDTVHDMVADVQRGQSAEVAESAPLDVSGPGSERTVYLVEGQAVTAQQRDIIVSGGTLPEAASDAVPTVAAGNRANGPVDRGGEAVSNSNASASASAGASKGNNGVSASVGLGNGNGNGNGTATVWGSASGPAMVMGSARVSATATALA